MGRKLYVGNLPYTATEASLREAFAASGTCLITRGTNDAWFVTGGAKVARLFHSGDRGKTWSVSETPIIDASTATISTGREPARPMPIPASGVTIRPTR